MSRYEQRSIKVSSPSFFVSNDNVKAFIEIWRIFSTSSESHGEKKNKLISDDNDYIKSKKYVEMSDKKKITACEASA